MDRSHNAKRNQVFALSIIAAACIMIALLALPAPGSASDLKYCGPYSDMRCWKGETFPQDANIATVRCDTWIAYCSTCASEPIKSYRCTVNTSAYDTRYCMNLSTGEAKTIQPWSNLSTRYSNLCTQCTGSYSYTGRALSWGDSINFW